MGVVCLQFYRLILRLAFAKHPVWARLVLDLADHKSAGAGDKGCAPQVVAKDEVQRVVLAYTCTCARCKCGDSLSPCIVILGDLCSHYFAIIQVLLK